MATNRFILVLYMISLSLSTCLFSFSASARDVPDESPASAPSPSSSYIAAAPSSYEDSDSASAPSPSPSPFSYATAFDIPEPQDYQTFSILPTNVDPGLQRICGDTDHPIECLTTTVPLLTDKVAIEPVSILKVEIEALNEKTREALAQATKLLHDPSNSEKTTSCLEQCIDSYNAVLDTNQKALEAIGVRDLYQLNMELSSNVENVNDCADSFKEARVTSPIEEVDTLLGKMISNNLAIGVDMVRF